MSPLILIAAFGAALGALVFAAINFFSVKKLGEGTPRMKEIASAIRIGANAFIHYEIKIILMVAIAVALLIVGFVFCLSAQLKAKKGFWWNRSVSGWLLSKLWAWLKRLAQLLPEVWGYLLGVVGVFGVVTLGAVFYARTGFLWILLTTVGVCALAVLYDVYAYGSVLRGARRMAQGELSTKIDTRFLIGSYKKCAESLNALAEVVADAARKRLRSERLKTELITNVSHDIKTPLTSIINYVDLLHTAKDQQTAQQYLQVLGRQSQRLKKLVDDLMEMSKATTGNLPVHMTELDPVEAVQQALGEFSDKLDAAQLQPVLSVAEEIPSIQADGRLLWRVLSNLLSNIVKYTMPGTRVYVDVAVLEEQVLISLKNISREPLNVSAEELVERFVRGDAARNTEGSGLGLNIAKTLMELQKGQLQLMVDGDLFKATLVFPK